MCGKRSRKAERGGKKGGEDEGLAMEKEGEEETGKRSEGQPLPDSKSLSQECVRLDPQ